MVGDRHADCTGAQEDAQGAEVRPLDPSPLPPAPGGLRSVSKSASAPATVSAWPDRRQSMCIVANSANSRLATPRGHGEVIVCAVAAIGVMSFNDVGAREVTQ
jgi:hypothetical protein